MLIPESIKQEIDNMLHEELSKVSEEHGDEFAEGWLSGCTWTINTISFFHRLEEMRDEYEGKAKEKSGR